MNKVIKTLLSAGSAGLILAGAALADPPVSFDVYSVSSGTITLGDYDSVTAGTQTCPAGYTCASPITGNGFMQRQLTDGSGAKYFQTIVTPTGATGAPSALAFIDESFVKIGVTGVSGKQHAVEASTSAGITTTFDSSSVLNAGWASGGSTYSDLELNQGVTLNDGTQNILYNGFGLKQNGPSDTPTGKLITISQGVLVTPGTNTGVNTDDDLQKFMMVEATGTLSTTARTLGAGGVLLPLGNKDLAWAAGDDIKLVWVAQQMPKSAVDDFRFQAYDNLTTAADDLIFSSEVGAFSSPYWTWVSPFGSAPTMTVP